ncbi:MAG: hypothetical protein WC269_03030 [Candidatus Gracilibacteria bacterium]|jgi:hypothetical protein
MPTLKQLIDYSKSNPESDIARKTQQQITAGYFDKKAEEEGLDLSWAGRPKPIIKQPETVVPTIGEKFMKPYQELPGKISENIMAGAEDLQKGNIVKGLAKSGLRTAGDFAGAIYSPIALPITETLEKTGASKLLSNFGSFIAEKTGLTDVKAIQDWAIAHPNAEEDFTRAMNLGMAGMEKGKIEPSTVIPRTVTQIKPIGVEAKAIVSDVGTLAQKAKQSVSEKVDIKKQGLANKAVDKLEQDYSEWTGATKSGVKKLAKSEAKTTAMTKAGTEGKTPQRILAENKIIPNTKGTKFDTAEQANQFRETLKPLQDMADDSLLEVEYSMRPTEISVLEKAAIKNAKELKLPLGDKASLINDIKNEYAMIREEVGNTMSVTEQARFKKTYFGNTKFDSTKPFKSDAYYQIGKSLQKNIEKTASEAGFDDVAQLNREIGSRLDAAKFLENLNGQTLKYGRIGKYVFMGIGASLGNSVVGKILGALGGDALGQMLMDANVANPVKRLILRNLETKSPEAYQATLEWMKQQGLDRSTRALLPAGKTQPIQLGGKIEAGVNVDASGNAILGETEKGLNQSLPESLSNKSATQKAKIDSNINNSIP